MTVDTVIEIARIALSIAVGSVCAVFATDGQLSEASATPSPSSSPTR